MQHSKKLSTNDRHSNERLITSTSVTMRVPPISALCLVKLSTVRLYPRITMSQVSSSWSVHLMSRTMSLYNYLIPTVWGLLYGPGNSTAEAGWLFSIAPGKMTIPLIASVTVRLAFEKMVDMSYLEESSNYHNTWVVDIQVSWLAVARWSTSWPPTWRSRA